MNRRDLKDQAVTNHKVVVNPATKLLWHRISGVPANALVRGSIYVDSGTYYTDCVGFVAAILQRVFLYDLSAIWIAYRFIRN